MAATSFAIPALLSRLREKIPFPEVGVKVNILVSELEEIQKYMPNAEQKQDKDKDIRSLLADIRGIIYEAEDVLDEYTIKVVAPKKRGGIKGVLFGDPTSSAPHKTVAEDIEKFSGRIKQNTESLKKHGVERARDGVSSTGGHEFQEGRKTSSLLKEDEDIVGLKEERKTTSSLLLNEENKSPVIAIWGQAGSGKTALAKLLYNDAEIRKYFQGFSWVTVGQTCPTKYVLQDTLVQLDIQEHSEEEIKQLEDLALAQMFSQGVQSKKCLVVLDDVWSPEAWESLRYALADQEIGSKVVVTTCNRDFAQKMAADNVCEINRLTDEESWNLFTKKAFANGDPEIGDSRIEMGKCMVNKCGGLPLAVVTLGNILASKPSSEWEKVKANIDSRKLSIDIKEAFSISYDGLPHDLKPCFLYLGHFPEDSAIEAEKLYLLWMAEGIIPLGKEKETVMETGRCCLDKLAGKGMVNVQTDEVPTIRRYKSCGLHDQMRQVCLKKAEAGKIFKVMDLRRSNNLNKDGSSSNPMSMSGQDQLPPRLAIYLDKYEDGYPIDLKKKIPSVMEKAAGNLRSLLFLNIDHHEEYILWAEEMFNVKEELRILRVLHFDGYSFQTGMLPKGIGKLLKLRYLSLRGCHLKELQSEIGNLVNLQTLDLRVATSCMMTIPDILWKLGRLRHLYLPVAFKPKEVAKLRFEGLGELQILENFDASLCEADHLRGLNNIQILNATTSGNNKDLRAIIDLIKRTSMCQSTIDVRSFDCYSDERIRILTDLFNHSGIHTLHLDGHIGTLAQISSSSLTKLSFNGSELVEDPMEKLGTLPNLWVLVLRDASYVGKDMVCSETSNFPQLRQLQLSGLHNLKRLTIENGAMPNLTILSIERCKSLEAPLDSLNCLTKLQELKISRMPTEFEDKIRPLMIATRNKMLHGH